MTTDRGPRAPGRAGRLRLALLDYGMGNLRSVAKALEHVGARPELTNDHARVRGAAAVVLPGVGAMPKAMEQVRRLGLDELLRERVAAGVPLNPRPSAAAPRESACWRDPWSGSTRTA